MLPTEHYASATLAAPLGMLASERRFEQRREVSCELWMIDHHGSTVLRCRCIEVSNNGMRLEVPLGYGVAEGQRYELRSHLPGAMSRTPLGLVSSRWATVVRTQLEIGSHDDHVEVGVVLDHVEASYPRLVS
jgi:hypothetical protein